MAPAPERGRTMAKKRKLELSGEPEAGAALSPIIGVAREDLIGAVASLLRETAANPAKSVRQMQAFGADVLKIMTGKSDLAPGNKDRRFADPAWSFNPFYRAGVQYYLAMQKSTQKWLEELDLDELERNRARFVSGMILDALSPTNTLAGNPSAIKRAIDSGGLSLMKGLKNAYDDMVHNDGMVSQVDKRPFTLGETIATTPGSVVWRTEMMELIQYAPTTDVVHAIPLITVPPQINKAYLNDLTPEKSIVRFQLAAGIQPFLISWRNPGVDQGEWGLGDYVDAVIEAIGVVTAITGATKVNLSGGCSGGITLATILSKMAAAGDDRANSATLMVCVLQPEATDSEAGALVSANGIALARQRSAKKGILEGTSLNRTFAWLRPNDLVWNYVINNYLHGEDPPAFDILFWNNDATNLPARLHSDYLDVYESQPFANPGTVTLAGHKVDCTKVTADLFIIAGVTDHITPWKACYRSTQLFGSKSVEFILSQSGHIQAILNPPGNPKARYFRSAKRPSASVDRWLEHAQEEAGSWWPRWIEWLKERSGKTITAPALPGNADFPPIDAAPGTYAHG